MPDPEENIADAYSRSVSASAEIAQIDDLLEKSEPEFYDTATERGRQVELKLRLRRRRAILETVLRAYRALPKFCRRVAEARVRRRQQREEDLRHSTHIGRS